MIDKVPKKLDIAGKERKRKEREQEGMIAIDSFPTPPPPKKKQILSCGHALKQK